MAKQSTCYLQLEPTWGYAYGDNEKPLRGFRAVGLTQKRPTKPRSGTVTVKLTLELPDRAFYPLQPEAVVSIPDTLTVVTPHVVAEDPHGDDE